VHAPAHSVSAPATVLATRYVAPLREGGSLPGLVEASDDGLYVLKFRGAGQGPKALLAELLVGELARRLELPVPDIVFLELDPVLGRAEPDPEIQDLIGASAGLNFGIDFLPGALSFDPAADRGIDPGLAAAVVWLDALVTNVDRSPRNPNLLIWHERLWLIDHGAALYLHHRTWSLAEHAREPFPAIRDHVLLPFAGSILEADERLAPRLERGVLEELAALLPGEWVADDHDRGDPLQRRAAYAHYLEARLAPPRAFAHEAEDARVR
jgi:HipA-like protein